MYAQFKTYTSCHVHLLVLNLLGGLSSQLINDGPINDLVSEVGLIAEDAELELLLFLLHFLLGFEEDLDDVRKSLSDGKLAEVLLLDLVSGELLSSAAGTAVILIACTRGLNHEETESLEVVVSSKSHRGTIRTLAGIHGVHLNFHAEALSQNRAWDLDAEHLFVLLSLLSCSVHESLTIGHKAVNDAAGLG